MSVCTDSRLNALRQWLTTVFPTPVESLEPASADASFRRYFRIVEQGRTWIVMDAPPERENVPAFLRVGQLLQAVGVHVPTVHAADPAQGFVVLDDFGNTSYHAVWTTPAAPALYQSALDTLLQMQSRILPADHPWLPAYDEGLLRRELHIFREWFLEGLLQLRLSAVEDSLWREVCDRLVTEALAQPVVFVHRDFHSRNLMVTTGGNPGVLDFQDAVRGPLTYDLVSLLRDCYLLWPELQVDAWVEDFRLRLHAAGMAGSESPAGFRRWFDWMGMQRHLKAVGLFARLKRRDDKPGYLAAIPRTLSYVTVVADQYPEWAAFGRFLNERVYAGSCAVTLAIESCGPP
jgi:aminoglycoside/choline kinase family phosphotransferase